jgi:hypothetical protein
MTNAQEDAFTKIEHLMREHFSSAVLVVTGELEGEDKKDVIRCTFNGGYAASIGLLELGKIRLWHQNEDPE